MAHKPKKAQRILVVDDEPAVGAALTEMLKVEGFATTAVPGGRDALRVLRSAEYDVMMTDVMLQDMSGLDLLSIVKDKYPWLPVIVITGYASVDSTISALRRGASDYIPKPFTSEVVMKALESALRSGEGRPSTRGRGLSGIVYRSGAMAQVISLVQRVSRSDSSILITGESGTGKELVARAIHDLSRRSGQPFVSVNSGALPEGLLESELFGHVRGAFTGAVSSHPGRFMIADGGSLFLDEVGNMSPSMQVKLLRVLQDREFTPVGGTEVLRVDVRLVAATNLDLEDAVAGGAFREDLYYRLNVIEIRIPPLRDRREDIVPLTEHFLARASSERNVEPWVVSPEAQALLMSWDWPGNVRELENTVERATVLASSRIIGPGELPPRLSAWRQAPPPMPAHPGEELDLPGLIESIERYYITMALGQTSGNRTRAAGRLGMKRTTLLARMRSLGMRPGADGDEHA